jgi:predicted GIY-YIG superfamily endonuclease
MPAHVDPNAEHYVYRCYDASGWLLYIGCTLNVEQRIATHRASAFWAYRIASITVEPFPTQAEALAAERAAIKAENPSCNVMSRDTDRSGWVRQHYIDAIRARQSNAYVPGVAAAINRLEREMAERFAEAAA